MQGNASTNSEPALGTQRTTNHDLEVDNYVMPTYMDPRTYQYSHYLHNNAGSQPYHASQNLHPSPAERDHSGLGIPIAPSLHDNRANLAYHQSVPQSTTYDRTHSATVLTPAQALLPPTHILTLHDRPPAIAPGNETWPDVSAEAHTPPTHVGQIVVHARPDTDSQQRQEQLSTAIAHSNDRRLGVCNDSRHKGFVGSCAAGTAYGASGPAQPPETSAGTFGVCNPMEIPYRIESSPQQWPAGQAQSHNATMLVPGPSSWLNALGPQLEAALSNTGGEHELSNTQYGRSVATRNPAFEGPERAYAPPAAAEHPMSAPVTAQNGMYPGIRSIDQTGHTVEPSVTGPSTRHELAVSTGSESHCAPGQESFDTLMWLAKNSDLNWPEYDSPQFAADFDRQLQDHLQAQQPAYPAPLPLNHVATTVATSPPERVYPPPVLQRSAPHPAPLQAASPTETFVSQYTGWSPSYPCTSLSSTVTTPGPYHGGQAEAIEPDVYQPQDDATPWPVPEETPVPIEHAANSGAFIEVSCRIEDCNRPIIPTVQGTKRHFKKFHRQYYSDQGTEEIRCPWKRPRGDICGKILKRRNMAAHLNTRHF